MNTKHKGDIALSQAIAYFINTGHEVLLPIGDRSDYDCVVEKMESYTKFKSNTLECTSQEFAK